VAERHRRSHAVCLEYAFDRLLVKKLEQAGVGLNPEDLGPITLLVRSSPRSPPGVAVRDLRLIRLCQPALGESG